MVGLGFNPRVGHLGTWDFSWGRSQRNCTLAKFKEKKKRRGRPCQSAQSGWSVSTMNCLAIAVILSLRCPTQELQARPRIYRNTAGSHVMKGAAILLQSLLAARVFVRLCPRSSLTLSQEREPLAWLYCGQVKAHGCWAMLYYSPQTEIYRILCCNHDGVAQDMN